MVTAPRPRAWQYMGAGQDYEHDPDTATRVWLDPGDLYIAAEPLTPDDIELAPVQPGRLGGKAEFASGDDAPPGDADDTPSWCYDEDGYCIRCGNGRWKHHMPDCELRDLLDASARCSTPRPRTSPGRQPGRAEHER